MLVNKILFCLTMCFAMRSSMPYNQSFFCKVDSNSQITLGNIPKKKLTDAICFNICSKVCKF